MFSKRMKLLVAAKDYEVRCERVMALDLSKKAILEMSKKLEGDFTSEAQCLRSQYTKVLNLLDFYEMTMRNQIG